MKIIRIISKNHRLSVIQAQEVISRITENQFQHIKIASSNNRNTEITYATSGGFYTVTNILEGAILNNEADIAVLPAKELPFPLAEGLEVIALLAGTTTQNVLVSNRKERLTELPVGAKVGFDNDFYKEKITSIRSDLQFVYLTNNIEEQIELVSKKEIDALIVSESDLKFLELDYLINDILPLEPHPLEGQLAIIARSENVELKSLFYSHDIRSNFGKVDFISLENNNIEMLTIKELQALIDADEIYYDENIDTNILTQFKANSIYIEKIDKIRNESSVLLYKSVLNSRNIVRLYSSIEELLKTGLIEYKYLDKRLITVNIIKDSNLKRKQNTKKILVTEVNSFNYEHLGEIVHAPLSQQIPIENNNDLSVFFNQPSSYDWILFLNLLTVNWFMHSLLKNNKDSRWLKNTKIMSINNQINKKLYQHGLQSDIILEDDSTEGIIDYFLFNKPSGNKLLIPQSNQTKNTLVDLLKKLGYFVDSLEVYQDILPETVVKVNLNDIDLVAFSSESDVIHFKKIYQSIPSHLHVLYKGNDVRRSLYNTGLLKYEPEWMI